MEEKVRNTFWNKIDFCSYSEHKEFAEGEDERWRENGEEIEPTAILISVVDVIFFDGENFLSKYDKDLKSETFEEKVREGFRAQAAGWEIAIQRKN